jgi:prolyl oligopeptidase
MAGMKLHVKRSGPHRHLAGSFGRPLGTSLGGAGALAAALVAPLLVSGCAGTGGGGSPAYPATRQVAQKDVFHGVEVADPYRWLEGDVRTDDEVAAWVKAQDRVARRQLADLPERDAFARRLEELWDFERRSAPERHGDHLYQWVNSGLEPQARLVRRAADGDGARDVTVIDPNTLSKDGTVAFAGGAFSEDGRFLAYGLSTAGSDWSTWSVLDLETLEPLADRIEGLKWGGVSWLPDGSGFFYARFDVPADGAFVALTTDQRVCFHRVGTPQSDDLVVHTRPDQPNWTFSPTVSDDGRWLVLLVWESGSKNLVHVFDLENTTAAPLEAVNAFTADYAYVGNAPDGALLFQTNHEAPNGRVVALDPRTTPPTWRDVIAESNARLEGVDEVGGQLVARYLVAACSRVERFAFATDESGAQVAATSLGEVALPGIGSASGFDGSHAASEVWFEFESFATPASSYRLDLASGAVELFEAPSVDVDPANFVVEQVQVPSKDGTLVPMFVCRRADVEPNGERPVLLYGYGGFDISLTPEFSVARLVWMEMGGVFAMPNLRGGGEFGAAWHRAGTRTQKQNVFDDFIASAEWLVASGWSRAERIAIQGGSNGGLLVGACLVQRPELFGACLPAVGVLDMLRFHLFTAGRYWIDDYGNVDDPAEFAALLAYSPYHNVKDGVSYPATLITTADTDDRVVPGHSFKFAARLQAAQAGEEPILLRVELAAGHGAGKPTAKRIAEAADVLAFAWHALSENTVP